MRKTKTSNLLAFEKLQDCQLKQLLQKQLESEISTQEKNCLYNLLSNEVSKHVDTLSANEQATEQEVEFIEDVVLVISDAINKCEPPFPRGLAHIAEELSRLLLKTYIPAEVQKNVAQALELWSKKDILGTRMLCVPVFQYFLTTSLSNTTLPSQVKHVWSFHSQLQHVDFRNEDSRNLIVPLVLKTLHNDVFLATKEGRNLMAFFMNRDSVLVKMLHQKIKVVLLNCKKKQASEIGDIYSRAINNASQHVRQVMVEECLNDLVLHVLQTRRKKLSMSGLGQQVMCVLKTLHVNRRNTSICAALVQVYEPLIWRYITSSNNIHRCNAAEVLMDVYPLMNPEASSMDNRELLERQHSTISQLLVDTCHVMRIIVLRELSRILCEFWISIPARWRDEWLRLMIQDLSMDGSSIQVRRGVFKYLSELLNNPQAANSLSVLLPTLYQHIHDNNVYVRKSFVNMLLNVKQSGLMQYYRVVPAEHLIARLEMEDESVGQELVSLLFSNILVPKQTASHRLKRIVCLASKSLTATRNFFHYSKHVLSTTDAVELMQHILLHIQVHMCSNKENVDSNKQRETLEPSILRGLLDSVSILWLLHTPDLNNQQTRSLQLLVRVIYPTLLNRYKGDDQKVLSSVLFLGSLVPIKILKKVCTGTGYCMSQIRRLTLGPDIQEQCLMWVSPVCNWGRAADVLNLAMEWLDEAFRVYNLNTSATQPSNKRVHFQNLDSKPLVALHVLDAVFGNHTNMCTVTRKNHSLVYNLWEYLERTKVAIEMHMSSPIESSMLNDEFLRRALLRYMKLTVLLEMTSSKTNEKFNGHEHILELMNWSVRVLLSYVPALELCSNSLPVFILQDMISIVDVVLAVGIANHKFNTAAIKFAQTLLQKDCALVFVHGVSCFVHRLLQYTQAYYGHSDDLWMFRKYIPKLLSAILVTFKKRNYSQAVVNKHIENFTAIRVLFCEMFTVTFQYYGELSIMAYNMVVNCVDAVVCITKHHIDDVDDMVPVRNIQDLPYLASQLIGMFRQRTVLAVMFVGILTKRTTLLYTKDVHQLTSVVYVLHALVHDPGIIPEQDLRSAANAAEAAIKTSEHKESAGFTTINDMQSVIMEKLELVQ